MLSVRGYYSAHRRQPYVSVEIVIDRLGVSATIEFLVDTGADYTAIHWGDRQLLVTGTGDLLPGDTAFADDDTGRGITGQPVRYGFRLGFASGPLDDEIVRRHVEVEACAAQEVAAEQRRDAVDLVLSDAHGHAHGVVSTLLRPEDERGVLDPPSRWSSS